MSFASDYATAYGLLRKGRVDRTLLDKVLYGEYDDAWREARDNLNTKRLDAVGRVKASIYAFKMVREMRRQKVLMNVLFNVPEDASDKSAVQTKHIHLFPVTVNRTVVKMQKDPND